MEAIRNKLTIVSCNNKVRIMRARENAVSFFEHVMRKEFTDFCYDVNTMMISSIMESPLNGEYAFMIMGDCGGIESELSSVFEQYRAQWIKKIQKVVTDILIVDYGENDVPPIVEKIEGFHDPDFFDMFETKDSNEWHPEYVYICAKHDQEEPMFCMFVVKIKNYLTWKGEYTDKGKSLVTNWVQSEWGEACESEDDAIKIFESTVTENKIFSLLDIIINSLSSKDAVYSEEMSKFTPEELKIRIDRIKKEIGRRE